MVRAASVLEELQLADLSAPGVMFSHFGLNLGQLASRRCVHTQQVSQTVHDMVGLDGRPLFDGL